MTVLEEFKQQVVDKLPAVDSYENHYGLKCVIIDDRGLKDTKRAMKSVKAIMPDANIVHYRDPVTCIEDHDLLLTSEEFWNRHKNESEILIFQPDSLVLNGSERYCIDLMDRYEYIGAPWDFNRAEKLNRWVGNGGLSLRDVEKSKEVIATRKFNSNIYHHEDTYFSYYMTSVGNFDDIFEAATRFSVEWHYYPKPFGIHDVEDHLSQKLVEKILKNSELNGIARGN